MKRVICSHTLDNMPRVVEYEYNNRVTYKYKKKYIHEGGRDTHNEDEGVYYEVFEENGNRCNPWDLASPILTEIDVYEDGYVGYVWNGRLNYLGHLVGNKVVK